MADPIQNVPENLPQWQYRSPNISSLQSSNRPGNMVYFWDSKYDKGLTSELNQRWNRADNQSGLGQIWNGFLSRGASIVPKIVGGFAGVSGFVQGLLDESKGIEYAWENDLMKKTQEWDEQLKEMLPVYQSAAYDNSGLLGKMLTTSMWATDFLDGAAFAVSAYAPGGLIGLAGKGIQAASVGTKMANLVKLGASRNLTTGLSTLYNTAAEASVEAFETQKSLEAIYLQRGFTKEEAKAKAAEHAKEVFGVNAVALLLPNYIQSRFFHKDFSAVAKEIRQSVIDKTALPLKSVLREARKGILSEGFYEENIQTAVQQYEKAIASNMIAPNTPLLESLAKGMAHGALDFGKGILGFDQTPEESERALSIFLGGVLGGGMGTVSTFRENAALTKMAKQVGEEYKGLVETVFPNALAMFKENVTVTHKKDGQGKVRVSLMGQEVEMENVQLDKDGNPIWDEETSATLVNRVLANSTLWSQAYQSALQGNKNIDMLNKELAMASLAFDLFTNKKSFDTDQIKSILDKQLESSKEDLERLGIKDNFAVNVEKVKQYVDTLAKLTESYTPNIADPTDFKFKGMLLKGDLYLAAKTNGLAAMRNNQNLSQAEIDALDTLERDVMAQKDLLLNKRDDLKKAFVRAEEEFVGPTREFIALRDKPNKTAEEEAKLKELNYKVLEAQSVFGTYALKGEGLSESPFGLNTSVLTSKSFVPNYFTSLNERLGRTFLNTQRLQEALDEKKNTGTMNSDVAMRSAAGIVTDSGDSVATLNTYKDELQADEDAVRASAMDSVKLEIDTISFLNANANTIEYTPVNEINALAARFDPNAIFDENTKEDAVKFLLDRLQELSMQNQQVNVQLNRSAEDIKAIEQHIKNIQELTKQDAELLEARDNGDVEKLENLLKTRFYEDMVGRRARDFKQKFEALNDKQRNEFEDSASTDNIYKDLEAVVLGSSIPEVVDEAKDLMDFIDKIVRPLIVKNSQNKERAQRVLSQNTSAPLYKFILDNKDLIETAFPGKSIEIISKLDPNNLSFDGLLLIIAQVVNKDKAAVEKALKTLAEQVEAELRSINNIDKLLQSYKTVDVLAASILEDLHFIILLKLGESIGMQGQWQTKSKWSGLLNFQESADIYSLELWVKESNELSSTEKAEIQELIKLYYKSTSINRLTSILNLDKHSLKDIIEEKNKAINSLGFTPSLSQNIVLTDALLFILSKDTRTNLTTLDRAFKLSGIAGSGKSFVIGKLAGAVVANLNKSKVDSTVYAIAPSTEASTNINKSVYDKDEGRNLDSFKAMTEADLSKFSLLIVDEAYLLGKSDIYAIANKAAAAGVKVIFMGDPSQRINPETATIMSSHALINASASSKSISTLPLTVTYRTSVDSISSFTNNYRIKFTVNHPASSLVSSDPAAATTTDTLSGVVVTELAGFIDLLRKPSSRSRVVIVSSPAEKAVYEADFKAQGINVEILTIAEMQGAQRDEVYAIVNTVQNSTAKDVDKNREFYTAFTRAKNLLVVTGIPGVKTSVSSSTSVTVDQSAEVMLSNKKAYESQAQNAKDIQQSFAAFLDLSQISPQRDAAPLPIAIEDSSTDDVIRDGGLGMDDETRDIAQLDDLDLTNAYIDLEGLGKQITLTTKDDSTESMSVGHTINYNLTPASGGNPALKPEASAHLVNATVKGVPRILVVTADHNYTDSQRVGKYIVIGMLSQEQEGNIRSKYATNKAIKFDKKVLFQGLTRSELSAFEVQGAVFPISSYNALGSSFKAQLTTTPSQGRNVVEEALITFYDTYYGLNNEPSEEDRWVTTDSQGNRVVDWSKLNKASNSVLVDITILTTTEINKMASAGQGYLPKAGLPYIVISGLKQQNSPSRSTKPFYIPMQPRALTMRDSIASDIIEYREAVKVVEDILGVKLGSQEFYDYFKDYLRSNYKVKPDNSPEKIASMEKPDNMDQQTFEDLVKALDSMVDLLVKGKAQVKKFATEKSAREFIAKAKTEGKIIERKDSFSGKVSYYYKLDTNTSLQLELDEQTNEILVEDVVGSTGKKSYYIKYAVPGKNESGNLYDISLTIGEGRAQKSFNAIARANFQAEETIIRSQRTIAGRAISVGNSLLPSPDAKGRFLYWDKFFADPAVSTLLSQYDVPSTSTVTEFLDSVVAAVVKTTGKAEDGAQVRAALINIMNKYTANKIDSNTLDSVVNDIGNGNIRHPLSLKEFKTNGNPKNPTGDYNVSKLAEKLSTSFQGVKATSVTIELPSQAIAPEQKIEPVEPTTVGELLTAIQNSDNFSYFSRAFPGMVSLIDFLNAYQFHKGVKIVVLKPGEKSSKGRDIYAEKVIVTEYNESTGVTTIYSPANMTDIINNPNQSTALSHVIILLHEVLHGGTIGSINKGETDIKAGNKNTPEAIFVQRLQAILKRFEEGLVNVNEKTKQKFDAEVKAKIRAFVAARKARVKYINSRIQQISELIEAKTSEEKGPTEELNEVVYVQSLNLSVESLLQELVELRKELQNTPTNIRQQAEVAVLREMGVSIDELKDSLTAAEREAIIRKYTQPTPDKFTIRELVANLSSPIFRNQASKIKLFSKQKGENVSIIRSIIDALLDLFKGLVSRGKRKDFTTLAGLELSLRELYNYRESLESPTANVDTDSLGSLNKQAEESTKHVHPTSEPLQIVSDKEIIDKLKPELESFINNNKTNPDVELESLFENYVNFVFDEDGDVESFSWSSNFNTLPDSKKAEVLNNISNKINTNSSAAYLSPTTPVVKVSQGSIFVTSSIANAVEEKLGPEIGSYTNNMVTSLIHLQLMSPLTNQLQEVLDVYEGYLSGSIDRDTFVYHVYEKVLSYEDRKLIASILGVRLSDSVGIRKYISDILNPIERAKITQEFTELSSRQNLTADEIENQLQPLGSMLRVLDMFDVAEQSLNLISENVGVVKEVIQEKIDRAPYLFSTAKQMMLEDLANNSNAYYDSKQVDTFDTNSPEFYEDGTIVLSDAEMQEKLRAKFENLANEQSPERIALKNKIEKLHDELKTLDPKSPESYKKRAELMELEEKIVVYNSMFQVDPLTGEQVITTLFKSIFYSNVFDTQQELVDYLRTIYYSDDLELEQRDEELLTAANISEHIREYNKNPELTLSANIKTFLASIMLNSKHVPISVSYYRMMYIALDVDWTKGLENVYEQISTKLRSKTDILSEMDKIIYEKFLEIISDATDPIGNVTARLDPVTKGMPSVEDMGISIVKSESETGQKLYHVVSLKNITEEDERYLRENLNINGINEGSYQQYALLQNTPRFRRKILISPGFTSIKSQTLVQETGLALNPSLQSFLIGAHNKLKMGETKGITLPRLLSNKEINMLVRRANAQDAIRDIMQGMGSMRKGELYVAMTSSDFGRFKTKFISSKASGITYSFRNDLVDKVNDLIASNNAVSFARQIISEYNKKKLSNKAAQAEFVRYFFGQFFGFSNVRFTAARNSESVLDTVTKIKGFVDAISTGKFTLDSKDAKEFITSEGDIKDKFTDKIEDLSGYISHFAGVLASDSNYQRNPSVRTLKGDRYYTIHESSQIFKVTGNLMKGDQFWDTYLKDNPYFSNYNIFTKATKSASTITQMGEFEGTRNENSGATVANLRQNKAKFFESRIIGGFMEGLRATNGKEYYQFMYPFDKPKAIVAKVTAMGYDASRSAVGDIIDQANYAYRVYGDSLDLMAKAKLIGFEVLLQAKARVANGLIKGKDELLKSPIIPDQHREKIIDEVFKIFDETANELYAQMLSPGVNLRFDSRINETLGKESVRDMLSPQYRSKELDLAYQQRKDQAFRTDDEIDSESNKEAILPLLNLYIMNTAINSYALHQATLGNLNRFDTTERVIKRLSSAAGPLVPPLIDQIIGSSETFNALVLNDTVISKAQLMEIINKLNPNLTEEQRDKLSRAFNKESYEITDGQGQMTPARKADLARGYGSSWKLGSVHKPLYYGVDADGNPTLIKYSSASPERSAFNSPLTTVLKELQGKPGFENLNLDVESVSKTALQEAISRAEQLGVGEVVFSSAVKLNPLKRNKAIQGLTFADLITKPMSELQDMVSKKTAPILYGLKNSSYGFQFMASDVAEKSVATPKQLTYFINTYEESEAQANRIYDLMADLITLGKEDFQASIDTPAKLRRFLLEKLSGQGNEMAYKLLTSGVSINHPGITDKAIIGISAGFEKASVKSRFKGSKLVLQSSEGIHINEPTSTINTASDPDKSFTKRDLQYKEEIVEINGVERKLMVAEAVVPQELLTTEEKVAIQRGEEIFIAHSLGFRIPTSEIHSAIALKVVGVYDSRGSNVVIVPNILVPLHGSDFDVDSLFLIRRETFSKRNLFYVSPNNFLTHRDIQERLVQQLEELKNSNNVEDRNTYEKLIQYFNEKRELKENLMEIEEPEREITDPQEIADIEAEFQSYVSTPNYSPRAGTNIIRTAIPMYDELRARKEWGVVNGYNYSNGKWIEVNDLLREIRTVNRNIKETLNVLKSVTRTLDAGKQKLIEDAEALLQANTTVVGESENSFIGYYKDANSTYYKFDTTLYDRLKQDYAAYTTMLQSTAGDVKTQKQIKSQMAILKDLMQKVAKNEILENMLDIVTSDNPELRRRMTTPITSQPLDEAIDDLKLLSAQAGMQLDKDFGNLDLWNPLNHYYIYSSLSSGAILTGAFANAALVFSYLNKASSRKLDETIDSLKAEQQALKELKKETKEKDSEEVKAIEDRIKVIRANIVELSKIGERGTALNPALSVMFNGEVKDRLNAVNGNFLITEVLDTLLNSAIDNLNEQKLYKVNINSRTGNILIAGLFLGIPLSDMTKLLAVPLLDTYTNGIYDKFEIFYGKTREAIGMSKEEMDEQNPELILSEVVSNLSQLDLENKGENFNKNLAGSYLKFMFNLNKIGDDIRYMASVYNLLSDHQVTIENIDAFELDFRDKVGTVDLTTNEDGSVNFEESSFVVKVREDFSFRIPGLFNTAPHLKAAYEAFLTNRDTINRYFGLHSPRIRQQLANVAPSGSFDDMRSSTKATHARKLLLNLIMAEKTLPRTLQAAPLYKELYDTKFKYSNTKSFTHEIATKVKAVKNYLASVSEGKTETELQMMNNAFLDHLSYVKDENGLMVLSFTSDTNLFAEDLYKIAGDFFKLNRIAFDKNGNPTSREPASKYEITDFQRDLFTYAELVYGLKFNTNNFSMFMNMENHINSGQYITNKLEEFKDGIPTHYIDLLKVYFGVSNMTKAPFLPIKKLYNQSQNSGFKSVVLGETAYTIHYDKYIYDDRGSHPKFYRQTSGNSTKLYMKIELPQSAPGHHFYTLVARSSDAFINLPTEGWSIKKAFSYDKPVISTHFIDYATGEIRTFDKLDNYFKDGAPINAQQPFLIVERGDFARLNAKVAIITGIKSNPKNSNESILTYEILEDVEYETPSTTSSAAMTFQPSSSVAGNVELFSGFWTRQEVANQPDKVFLFGDNTNDRLNTKYIPSSTQAVIRGLPNAIGIDTKKDRGTNQGTNVQGENISSRGSEFAKKLTNVGNAVGLTYKGRQYVNSEHAYQTWKSGEFNQAGYNLKGGKVRGGKIGDTFSIMTDILTEKLKQHPELVEGINKRGGLTYIEQSTHNVIGDKFWESIGQNKFIEALLQAAKNVGIKNENTSSYFTNADFAQFKLQVDEAIQEAKNSGKTIVIPADGIGTGKAMLKEKAPLLFEYLQQELSKLQSPNIESSAASFNPIDANSYGNNQANDKTGRSLGVDNYIVDDLAAKSADVVADTETHTYSVGGLELKSVTSMGKEFSNREDKTIEEMVEAKVQKFFKNVPKGEKIQIRGIEDPISEDEYRNRLIDFFKRNAAMGEILHLISHSLFSGDPNVSSRIAKISSDNSITEEDYNWFTNDFIVKLFGERMATNYFDQNSSDKIVTELVIASRELGIAGRIDIIVDHGNNVVSLYDLKTGKSFNKVFNNVLLKYGDVGGNIIYDTPRSKAQLQLALYAFILKAENPNIKFREIKNIHIANKEETQDSALNVVDLGSYLTVIESYYKNAKPEVYKKLKASRPDLFEITEYMTADTMSVLGTREQVDPALELSAAINELQKLILYDKDIADLAKAGSTSFKGNRAKRIAELTEKIIKLKGQKGINYTAISSDISWMDAYLGSSSYSTHPYVQLYHRMLSEAKNEGRKEYGTWVAKYRILTKRLIQDSGIKPTTTYIGGIDRNKLFQPLMLEVETGEVTSRRLIHKDDPQYNSLTAAQKEWLDYVNSSIKSVFVDEGGRVALANKTVSFRRKKGTKSEIPVTNLDLYNGKGGNIRHRPEAKKEFKYYDGFFPKIAPEFYDVAEKHGVLSQAMLEFTWRKYFTFYNEQYYEGWMNQTEAIPMKYLDKTEILNNESYSLNLEKAVDSFMKHHIFKDKLDNVYAFAQGLKIYLMAKEAVDDNLAFKNLINFIDKSIEMQLLGKKQQEIGLSRRVPYLTKGGRVKEFNAIKFVHSLKMFMYGPTMWIKPITGMANFVFASMVNYKEALKGSLGLKGSYTNFTASDLFEGYRLAWQWQMDALMGNMRKNKLYLLMEDMGYLPDNYDHYVQPNELLTTRNRMFSTRTLTMFHTIPEEIIAASLFYAQMKSIKLQDNSSVWDHYELVRKTTSLGDEYYTVEWDGTVRGEVLDMNIQAAGNTKPLTGLTTEELANIKFLYEKMHGGYRGEERTVAEYYIFGDLALQLKRFMPATLKNAFASRGFRTTEGNYVDRTIDGRQVKVWTPALVEGRWRMLAGMMFNGLRAIPEAGFGGSRLKEFMEGNIDEYMGYKWDSLSEVQKRDMLDMSITFLALGVMLMGYHTMWDADDEDPFKKLYQRVMNDFTLLADPIELLNNAVGLLYQPVAPTKWKKLVVSSGSLLYSILAYGFGDEKALTQQGNIRGWKEFQRHIPLLSAWRDVFKFSEELAQEDAIQRYR